MRKYGSYIGKKFYCMKHIEIVLEEVRTLDLLHKDFSSTVLNMYKELKETIAKELKKSKGTMLSPNNHINKET